ncbi:MAG: hypothetical protein KAU50_03905 [Candidatus Marinimicrobia bacterium]|nr:hypothetical protein [Candidatus Neomarinimicrobiota bacterium]
MPIQLIPPIAFQFRFQLQLEGLVFVLSRIPGHLAGEEHNAVERIIIGMKDDEEKAPDKNI